jgi:hypothetical protein
MKRSILATLLIGALLSACGPKATPTANPADVQSTAVAMAWTMAAQTQAAIPTATPVPTDTPTPLPTETSQPTPTSKSLVLPTATPKQGQGNCVHPLDIGAAGPTHPTIIKNQTGGTISLSLNLYKPNAFGECGAISFADLSKGDSVSAQLPAGYWYAYAWATVKGKQFTVSGSFYVQEAQFDKLELCVRTGNIIYSPQC